ncbi:MAG: hypothetical protein KC416_06565 [Myxococcales bacterium]|nr:hypothetical protein [Myxococcales bacterium]
MRIPSSYWPISPSVLSLVLVLGCSNPPTSDGELDASPPITNMDAGGDSSVVDAGFQGDPDCIEPPTHLKVSLNGSEGTIRLGHSGYGHGIKLNDGVEWYLELFDCDEQCGECSITGPVAFPGTAVKHQRCVKKPEVPCETDEDCGGETCAHFLGPNISTKLVDQLDLELCSLVHLEELDEAKKNGSRMDTAPVQGSVNLRDGTVTITSMNIGVASWPNIVGDGCGTCVNDPVPFDGNANGTCAEPGAPLFIKFSHGVACDVQATRTNGSPSSYECYPSWDQPTTYSLQLAQTPLATRSLEWELSADHPDCEVGGGKCWCGVCDDGSNLPCNPYAPCPDGVACVPAKATTADTCVGPNYDLFKGEWPPASCQPSSNDEELAMRGLGICKSKLPGTDGLLAVVNNRPCLSGDGQVGSVIRAIGMADVPKGGVSESTVAALACFPGSGNTTLDGAMGTPGPSLIEMPLRSEAVGGKGFWNKDKK